MTSWWADLVTRRRLWLALVAMVTTAAALVGAAKLQFDDQPKELFRRSDADFAQLEQLVNDFGPDDNDVVVVIEGDELFTPKAIKAIGELVSRLYELDSVERVQSLASLRRPGSRFIPLLPPVDPSLERCARAKRDALAHPLVVGQLLSPDAKTMLVVVRLKGEALPMSQVESTIQKLREEIQDSLDGTGLFARLAGHPAIRVDLINTTRRERTRFTLVSAAVSALIAMLLFRRLAAVALCVAGPAVGVIWTLGLLGMLGERINVLGTIIPSLLFVVGFTDSVHLMVHIRNARSAGKSPQEAAREAVCEVGAACALTSLTTCVAFLSLVLAELDAIQRFGLACACGSVLTFASTILVVPLLASTRWGSKVGGTELRASILRPMGRLDRMLALMLRHPRIVAATGVGTAVVFAVGSLRVRPDIRWTESLPRSSETRQVIDHCDKAFGGSLLVYVVVQWPDRVSFGSRELWEVTGAVQHVLDQQQPLRGSFSVATVLKSVPGRRSPAATLRRIPEPVRDRLVRTDLRRLVVTAHVPDVGAASLEPVFTRLEEKLAQLEKAHRGFQLKLTGTSVVAARNVRRMIGDLGRSLAMTALIVFLILILAFRSVKLGLISILPNAFPLLLVGGWIGFSGEPLRIASVLTFSLCLGIAVDDTIHFLARYRRELRVDGDRRAAVHRSMLAVGAALVTTTVVLVGGFSAVLISDMPPLRSFGQLACTALIAALVGDIVILPALLLCFPKGPVGKDRDSAPRAT